MHHMDKETKCIEKMLDYNDKNATNYIEQNSRSKTKKNPAVQPLTSHPKR